MKNTLLKHVLLGALASPFFLLTSTSIAASAKKASDAQAASEQRPEPTVEQRQEMAKMHESMAVCLRSTKTMKECHEEMKAACNEKEGEHNCPMMGHGMGGPHGMGHHGMGPGKKHKPSK